MFGEGVRFQWLKRRRRSRSNHGGPTRLDAARLSGLIGTARLGDADRPSKRWRSFWRKRNVTRAKRNGSDSFAVQRLWSSYRSGGTSRDERKVLFGMQRRCRDDDLAENRNQRRLARRPALRITRRRARAIEPAIGSPSPIRINIRPAVTSSILAEPFRIWLTIRLPRPTAPSAIRTTRLCGSRIHNEQTISSRCDARAPKSQTCTRSSETSPKRAGCHSFVEL